MEPVACLVTDPPWTFQDRLGVKGASAHYGCLSLSELKGFPLPPLADNGYLFLWRVAALQSEALELAKAWGYTIKTELVWRKLTATGKRHFGLGRHFRAEHEICLVGTRGKPKPLRHDLRTVFEAQVRQHSRKPDEFYRLVESFCPGPRAELFARQRRPGWLSLGNEVDKWVA